MPSRLRLSLLPILWLGAALRLWGLFANSFHADEALFATWARLIAVWRDPLLRTQPVDKPPLLFYSQAIFYPLLGPVEWAARLPSLIASLLLIALTAQLAWRLGGDSAAALVAAAVVAVAPLAVQFSATAFSDPLLTMWLVAALVAALARPAQPGWAGVGLGLALATKYQAALFVPLLAGLGWLAGWRGRDWARAAVGTAAVVAVVLLWSAARADAAGLVASQWANIGGLRPARSWELWPRLADQARLWRLALGGPLLAGAALATAVALLSPHARARLRPADALLALFALAYALLHWLWAVPAWDRYLLPLVPVIAVLLGRLGAAAWSLTAEASAGRAGRWAGAALLVAVAALHVPVAVAARAGQYPIGGQPTADGGAAEVARALADAPYGTVLYDHWYSWHWRYQLFDGRVYVSWFPHADALLADLAAFGQTGPARLVALPRDGTAAPLLRRLRQAGYRLESLPGPAEATMTLWRIAIMETNE
ncbi:MAG: glycosyltransferase family 39 protein [Anaerolineae bacterium]|nr:glycosyltransferase family 39 protein [Anaerolineae bacterium]